MLWRRLLSNNICQPPEACIMCVVAVEWMSAVVWQVLCGKVWDTQAPCAPDLGLRPCVPDLGCCVARSWVYVCQTLPHNTIRCCVARGAYVSQTLVSRTLATAREFRQLVVKQNSKFSMRYGAVLCRRMKLRKFILSANFF